MAPASSFIPGFGIEAVAQLDLTPGTGNVGYTVPAGHEWYYWHVQAGEWLGAENDRSMLDLLRLRRPIVGVSSGERIPTERYQAILAKARDWAQAKVLPRKSGFRPGEFVP